MTKKKLLLKAKTLKVKAIILKHKLNKTQPTTLSNISSNLFMPNKKDTSYSKYLNEFYDIPYTYNETTVKVLAQNPTTLFVYWDISDEHRKYTIEKYGPDFFYTTKPILLVKNETTKESFEIEINDFANNWYITVPTTKCKYRVELLRKPIENSNEYIYMASSNLIEAPNDHVLIEDLPKNVTFFDIKSKTSHTKNIDSPKQKSESIQSIFHSTKMLKKKNYLKTHLLQIL